MVFQSQVLEYLLTIKEKGVFDSVELIIFRHEANFFNKERVEKRVSKFIDSYKTFATLPILSMAQLDFSAYQLSNYINRKYKPDDEIAVICRGDLAGYVGGKVFRKDSRSRVLFDNRGLSFEESEMSHGDQLIHRINRIVKRKAMMFAKMNCDMYNFVTRSMREYMINKYGYKRSLPFTIIPTLYKAEDLDEKKYCEIQKTEEYTEDQFVVSYIGSIQAWQSLDQLKEIIISISESIATARFMFLMNGSLPGLDSLPLNIQRKISIKSIPHEQIKYYLAMSDIGIVIRDNNIVNKVAAPTKIAEYITNGVTVLYGGDIGIVKDLHEVARDVRLIEFDSKSEWLEKIIDVYRNRTKKISKDATNYFDMNTRLEETIDMINASFGKMVAERGEPNE